MAGGERSYCCDHGLRRISGQEEGTDAEPDRVVKIVVGQRFCQQEGNGGRTAATAGAAQPALRN